MAERKNLDPDMVPIYLEPAAKVEMPPLISIALLIDELKNEDVCIRLNSFQKIDIIARALGETRTRTEFIPFLSAFIGDDEEEILITLSQKLSAPFLSLVGGANFADCLLSPLKLLASVDEPSVNDAAIASMITVIQHCSNIQIENVIFPIVESLGHSSLISSKRSCCPLIPVIITKIDSDSQMRLVDLYVELSQHDSPVVRRSACNHFGKLLSLIPSDIALSKLFPPFKKLADDPHDSVRLLSVQICCDFGKVVDDSVRASELFPIVRSLCSDECWRVRYMAADKFRELCDVIANVPDSKSTAIDNFVSLLQDSEAEVRTAAASRVTEVSKLFSAEVIISKIIPAVTALSSDPSQFARGALASNVMGICSLLEPAQASSLLVPLFLKLLKDDKAEVRLNIISKLEAVGNIIGLDQLSRSLMPAIIDLACDGKWRVRLTVIQHIPNLAKELGVELFEQRLSEICMAWMVDEVFSVREAATKNLTELVKVFGPQWAISYVSPRIKDMTANTNYLHRMTALYATSDLAESIRSVELIENMLPIILAMIKDPVPNIRFGVAKTIEVILRNQLLSDDTIKRSVEPSLLILLRDSDPDVRYFAQRAAKLIPTLKIT